MVPYRLSMAACPSFAAPAHSTNRKAEEAMAMKRVFSIVFAAGVITSPALAQEVDIKKAVTCQALAQQFGDSIKTVKAEEAAKKAATDQAKQGDQACNQHDYDAGIDQLRQALQQVGLKVVH
jgi:hypothetical protein